MCVEVYIIMSKKHSIMKWEPDSCPCIVLIQLPEYTLSSVIQKCHLHKDISDKKLLDTIRSHNKKYGSREMITKRREEYLRIKSLSDPEIKNYD